MVVIINGSPCVQHCWVRCSSRTCRSPACADTGLLGQSLGALHYALITTTMRYGL
jgi:hypothetical protein